MNYKESGNKPAFQLFCLPYAGGTAQIYRRFSPYISPAIELIPIDTPGHGTLFAQPPIERMDDLVDFVCNQIQEHRPRRYALCGHSLGAHVAYLAARKLLEKGYHSPLHLFLSGKPGPSVPFKHRNIHLLPSVSFLTKLREYGGLPDEFFAEPELIELFLPVLTADFQAISTYQYKFQSTLTVPVTLFISNQDINRIEEFRAWELETTASVNHYSFAGNHFFIFDHLAEIGRIISDTLVLYRLKEGETAINDCASK